MDPALVSLALRRDEGRPGTGILILCGILRSPG